jgi:hypothetical protein
MQFSTSLEATQLSASWYLKQETINNRMIRRPEIKTYVFWLMDSIVIPKWTSILQSRPATIWPWVLLIFLKRGRAGFSLTKGHPGSIYVNFFFCFRK